MTRSSLLNVWMFGLISACPALEAQVTDAASDDVKAGVGIESTEAANVARQPFDPIAATQAYLARVPTEERQRSDRYFEGGYWLQLWSFLYGLGISALLLFSRLSAKMRDVAERATRFLALQPGVYWIQYSVLTAILGLPWAIYVGYFREHQYSLSNLTIGGWFGEWAIGLGVGLVTGGLALMVLYGVLRRATRSWWIWGALTSIGLVFFALMIQPVFIAPLTNTYTALEDGPVRGPIMRMATAHGVVADEIWVVNESAQTSAIGAGVTGLLGTQRISLNDNLLNRASLPTIKFVMAHELGHYVLNQMYFLLVSVSVLVVIAFAFLRVSFDRVLAKWGQRWGVRGIGDPAGLPILVALILVFFFAATPVTNTMFRSTEAAADQFALSVSREPDGLAEGVLLLSEYRKLDPGPLEEFVFYDHPSGRNRILAAMRWKAEYLDEVRD